MLGLGALAASFALVLGGTGRHALPPIAAHAVPPTQSWLAASVGPTRASAPLERTAGRHVRVSLGGAGVVARTGSARVALATLGTGRTGAWTRHAAGVTRKTSFGAETITVGSDRTEILLRVDRRLGTHMWSWRLRTSARPRAQADGSVALGARLAIAPVHVYDTRGLDVTPRGAHWSLTRTHASWQISLRLDDARLPAPYVIDPTVQYRPTVAADGPSHQWLLDDTGATAVDSVDGATGTYEGSSAQGQPSLVLGGGSSVLFHGSPDDIALGPIEAPMSIEAWVQFTSGAEMPIFSNAQQGGGDVGAIYFGVESGHLFAFTHGGPFWESTATLNDGAIHYVAFVNHGGTGQLYVDGEPDGSAHSGIPAPAAPTTAYIGHDLSNGGVEYWVGSLDEIATYSTALSAARIRAHYLAGVDNTAPVISFSTGPADNSFSNQTDATFTFATDDGSPTTCHLDGAADAACTSPQAFTGLAEGAHTFTVSAVDEAGNSSSTTIHWTVDTTPPTATAGTTPADPNNSATQSFQLQADEPSTYLCSLDGGPFTACGSGTPLTNDTATYTNLGDGAHTFAFEAVDRAGNVGAPTATFTWHVDRTGPDVAFTSAPDDPTSSTTASFSFTATDDHPPAGGFTFQCTLDGVATSCAGGHTVAEGAHTFTVQSTDALGNVGQATATWTVDTTKPVTTISSGPDDPTNQTSATFTFGATDASAVTYTCKLDTSVSSCTSPFTRSGLGDGAHTFTVTATDAAGNVETSGPQVTWHVDTTAPTLAFTSGPADGSGTATPASTFTFSAADASGTTTSCQVDAQPAAACSSPFTTPALAEGPHTLTVTATDAALNSTTKTVSWTVDLTAPGGTLVSPTTGNTVTSPVQIDVSATDNFGVTNVALVEGAVTRATLHLASGSPTSGLWMGTWSTTATGTHTLSVVVTDVGGNTHQIPLVVTVGPSVVVPIDVSPPTAPPDFNGQVHDDGLVFYWGRATDAGTGVAHYFLWIDGRIVDAYGPTEFQSSTFPDFGPTDTRVFQLDANDAADNLGPFAPALTGVPLVTGRTLDDAKAALLSRGFAVGAVTEVASPAQPGTVVAQTPASPAVAPVGSAVDLAVSKQGGQATLVLDVTVAHRILLSQRRFIAIRVELSLASTVTSTLYDPRGHLVQTWRRDGVPAGATIIQLRLPKTVKRTGVYRLVVRADGGGQTTTRTLRIRLVGANTAKVRPITKQKKANVEIALVSGADIRAQLAPKLHRMHLLYVTDSKVFRAASANNVGVAVVDLDTVAPNLVAQLRLVFPELRVIALASSPAQAAAARSAGASIVLTKPASATLVAAAIRSLVR